MINIAFTKRAYSKTRKIFIYGTGTLLALFTFLAGLGYYGVDIKTSGDITCAGTSDNPCVSYVNITTNEYGLKFPTGVLYFGDNPPARYELYKADLRYKSDNPARWKAFNISGKTMGNESRWELKIVGYKNKPSDTVKWGFKMGASDKDPYWFGNTVDFDIIGQTNSTIRNYFTNREFYMDVSLPYPKAVQYSNWNPGTKVFMRNYTDANILIYPIDGGVEYEIIFKSKPAGNTLDMKIDAPNLNFYYQPPLTQQLNISEYDYMNETDAIKGGVVVEHRDDNVVGSYAVYSSKKDNQYQTGKVAHIYRPLLIDSTGKKSWANLSISGGTMTITADQKFLDTAAYPVIVDPTFGYTACGGTDFLLGTANYADGGGFVSPSDIQYAQSISVCARALSGRVNVKPAIWDNSSLNLISGSVGDIISFGTTAGFNTSSYSPYVSLSPSTDYVLGMVTGGSSYMRYDSVAGFNECRDTTNSYTTPANMGSCSRTASRKMSTYIDYENIPPQHSLNSTNSTLAGTVVSHNLYWTEDTALNAYIFSFNNGTGTFVNDSAAAFAGVGTWSNVSKKVNSTAGSLIQWIIYANDTSDNWNASTTFSYVTSGGGDSTPPTFSLNSANATIAGNPVNFSVKISDETALSGYIFETNNSKGTFINTTWFSLASGGTAQNITTLNSTVGLVVNYSFYANDSSNNWAVGRWSITTTSATSCTCPAINTNWAIDMTENCQLNTTCDLGVGNLSFSNAGNFYLNNTLKVFNMAAPSANQIVWLRSNATLNITG